MSPEFYRLQKLTSKFSDMDIEELKETISIWEKESNSSYQRLILDIAKKELNLRYKDRQEQIELLTKSLTCSSRIGRWISSIKALIK